VKKIRELLNIYREKLRPVYQNQKEIEAVFFILLKHFHNISRLESALNPEKKVEEKNLLQALTKLEKHTPWQYITGQTDFYDIRLKVNRNVLIPRPETEELVDWIINENKRTGNLKILDIGTGSGAIALSLAKNLTEAKVYALDISEPALEIARENAKNLNVKLYFIKADVLKMNELPHKFDIIVSNPPYVLEKEKKYIKKNVLDYEPSSAIFVPDQNPLIFYEKIMELFMHGSKMGGKLYFEINENLKPDLEQKLKEKNLKKYQFKKDIFGKWRMLKICN